MKRARGFCWLIAGLLLLAAWPTLAGLSSVAGLFQAGEYAEARKALADLDQDARPGEELLWRSRLATRPTEALGLLEPALQEDRFSTELRIRLALEVAEIQAGRGNHREALDALAPLLGDDIAELPGAVYLRAALSLRARGKLQQAREMLASVRPADPLFVLARYYLGDIGLEQDDAALALRYFEAAAEATNEAGAGRLAAGLWRARMASGQEEQAAQLLQDLQQQDSGSLALLEIRRLVQAEADERDARNAVAPNNAPVPQVIDTSGRYALQLGAFSDRGLALDFVKRYKAQLPDLHIDQLRDERGQFLYKVRTGDFVNPALARSEAKQLEQRLGIEIIVADLTGVSRQDGN